MNMTPAIKKSDQSALGVGHAAQTPPMETIAEAAPERDEAAMARPAVRNLTGGMQNILQV